MFVFSKYNHLWNTTRPEEFDNSFLLLRPKYTVGQKCSLDAVLFNMFENYSTRLLHSSVKNLTVVGPLAKSCGFDRLCIWAFSKINLLNFRTSEI